MHIRTDNHTHTYTHGTCVYMSFGAHVCISPPDNLKASLLNQQLFLRSLLQDSRRAHGLSTAFLLNIVYESKKFSASFSIVD
jgi:hypothetical protein